MASLSTLARAGSLDQSIQLDISADTPLDEALLKWSAAAGMQVMVASDSVGHERAPAVHGQTSAGKALTQLLKSSGLTYTIVGNTVRVVPAAALVRSAEHLSSAAADPSAPVAASTPPEPSRLVTLEEVVVTANKREERMMDVPVSITALSGQELEQTMPQSLVDFSGLVPGLTVTSGGAPGESQIVLRGIATGGLSFGSLVGTYIDEMPIGASSGMTRGAQFSPDLMPYDLERIEVLNGPQGTLYGASSMGGLIKYVLKDPDLSEMFGRAGGIVQYIDRSGEPGGGARAAINLPIIEGVFGIRVSGYDQKTQGYINNIGLGDAHYNPYTQQGGRFIALWKASDYFSVKFSGVFQKIDSRGSSDVTVDPTTLQNMYGDFTRFSSAPESFLQHTQLYSLVVNWNLGFASLLSASGWQKTHTTAEQDLTPVYGQYSPFPNTITPFTGRFDLNDKFTEEVRLTSPASQRLEWMLGAFYTHEGTQNYQDLSALSPSGGLLPGQDPFFIGVFPATYDEVAGFLNGTLHFNEQVALTAGARYAGNRQKSSEIEYGGLLGNLIAPAPTYTSSSQDVTTWMVSPQWHLNSDAMLYARVATGYRPGGWTFAAPPAPQSYQADTTTNYELGLKSTLLDQHVVLNAAVYDIQWKNVQTSVQDPVTKLIYLGNGGSARSRGGELAVSYTVNDGVHLGTTFGYTDARLTADSPGTGGKNGDRLPLSAKFNGAVTADFKQSMPRNWALKEGVAIRYSSSIWTGTSGGVETGAGTSSSPQAILVQQPHPVDLYASALFTHFEARLFARNVFTSEPSVTFLRDAAYWAPNELTYTTIAPRTFGLDLEVVF